MYFLVEMERKKKQEKSRSAHAEYMEYGTERKFSVSVDRFDKFEMRAKCSESEKNVIEKPVLSSANFEVNYDEMII